ncbi:hypothetical protein K488DRAFT_70837 [Vararia minispora EC-137]|uniref:Uncharacterized protein n=1 Tax=Vararia minispora EC-137 TaxID=1314806 RepID=A0ACB8QKR4_9AGAM|nr:hypothetical protein K488DRAFT_70837 [Vararia minispora EC-137]
MVNEVTSPRQAQTATGDAGVPESPSITISSFDDLLQIILDAAGQQPNPFSRDTGDGGPSPLADDPSYTQEVMSGTDSQLPNSSSLNGHAAISVASVASASPFPAPQPLSGQVLFTPSLPLPATPFSYHTHTNCPSPASGHPPYPSTPSCAPETTPLSTDQMTSLLPPETQNFLTLTHSPEARQQLLLDYYRRNNGDQSAGWIFKLAVESTKMHCLSAAQAPWAEVVLRDLSKADNSFEEFYKRQVADGKVRLTGRAAARAARQAARSAAQASSPVLPTSSSSASAGQPQSSLQTTMPLATGLPTANIANWANRTMLNPGNTTYPHPLPPMAQQLAISVPSDTPPGLRNVTLPFPVSVVQPNSSQTHQPVVCTLTTAACSSSSTTLPMLVTPSSIGPVRSASSGRCHKTTVQAAGGQARPQRKGSGCQTSAAPASGLPRTAGIRRERSFGDALSNITAPSTPHPVPGPVIPDIWTPF